MLHYSIDNRSVADDSGSRTVGPWLGRSQSIGNESRESPPCGTALVVEKSLRILHRKPLWNHRLPHLGQVAAPIRLSCPLAQISTM
jgi:hypothetical protein